jgi:hypothetical protein
MAGFDDASHNASLDNMGKYFANVKLARQILERSAAVDASPY